VSIAVALYGPDGLLDRRPADDEADAIRVLGEIAHERSILRAGYRIEIEDLSPIRTAISEACAEVRAYMARPRC
jgi:hypothetical protein